MPIATYDPATGDLLGTQRLLWDIYTDVGALTASQVTAVWNDLMTGSPPKLALDEGTNAASIFTMHFLATAVGSLTATEKNDARRRLIAYYIQDQPRYLEHPAFDPTILILGYVPAT